MEDPLEPKSIFFSNLLLLGFDPGAMEAQHKQPFNENMFDLPNKKGAEVVLYFLFDKLNPVMCKEEFRHSWPIYDKQGEQQFRRSCHNWLVNIAKNEPDARLPRVNASLFMSPGGEKFCHLLLQFSGHVLRRRIYDENGVKDYEHIQYTELNEKSWSLGDVIAKNIQCGIARWRQQMTEEAQAIMMLNYQWKSFTHDYVREYRKLSKEIREHEYQLRAQRQIAIESGTATGSTGPSRRKSDILDQDFDGQSSRRFEKVLQVRGMWKGLNEFYAKESAEREVIESIVDRALMQQKIDASEISIKVPDLLLRECEQEIRRRHVDNTFHGGNLNLISLLQLWNLCLHLYLERLHKDGVADFSREIGSLSEQVHTNHAYLTNAKNLRKHMSDILPELKKSVEALRDKLSDVVLDNRTPTSIRTTSFGLGLTEPSPRLSFTPEVVPSGLVPKGMNLKKTPSQEATPEAASKLAEGISKTIRKGKAKLFQGFPEYAPMSHISKASNNSQLPRKTKKAKESGGKKQLQSTPTKAHHRNHVGNMETQGSSKDDSTLTESKFHSYLEDSKDNTTITSSRLEMSTSTSPPASKVQQPEAISPSEALVKRVLDGAEADDLDHVSGGPNSHNGTLTPVGSPMEESPPLKSSSGGSRLQQPTPQSIQSHLQDLRNFHESLKGSAFQPINLEKQLEESLRLDTCSTDQSVSSQHGSDSLANNHHMRAQDLDHLVSKGNMKSPSSELSEPSGVFDDDDDEGSQWSTAAPKSKHVSLRLLSDDSFELEVPNTELTATQSDLELEERIRSFSKPASRPTSPQSFSEPRPTSPVAEILSHIPSNKSLRDLDLEDQCLLDAIEPPEGMDGEDVGEGDERAISDVDKTLSGNEDDSEDNTGEESPLKKELRSMVKELLKTTYLTKPSRSELSFLKSGKQMDLHCSKPGPFVDLLGGGDGLSLDCEGENLSDVQFPDISFGDHSPQMESFGNQGPDRDDHVTFSPDRVNHVIFSPERDNHMTFSLDRDDHVTFSPDRANHVTFSPDRDDHVTFSPDRGSARGIVGNHVTFSPVGNHVTFSPEVQTQVDRLTSSAPERNGLSPKAIPNPQTSANNLFEWVGASDADLLDIETPVLVDVSDEDDNLDDSFVPFKAGVQVERHTPKRSPKPREWSTVNNRSTEDSTEETYRKLQMYKQKLAMLNSEN